MARWFLDRLDLGAAEAGARLRHSHGQPVAGESAPDEEDVPARAADAFPAEGEVVDRDSDTITTSRFRHGCRHYKERYGASQLRSPGLS
jgi:hypothetical protein